MATKFERAIATALANPGHDYPDDFKHENGMYMQVCIRQECKETFTGGKYRFICKKCSDALPGRVIEAKPVESPNS
jgi:hypothetical protein